MNRILVILGLIGAGCLVGHAEVPTPPADGPVVAPVPPGMRWQVEIEGPNGVQSSDGELRMHVGRNGVQFGQIVSRKGEVSEFFVVENWILQRTAESGRVTMFPQDSLGMTSLRRADWPGLFWIVPENFQEVRELDGVECFYFERTGLPGSDLPDDMLFTAWIRTTDRKPIKASIGDVTYVYSELTSAPENVNLPPDYAAALSGYQKRLRVLETLRAAH